MPPIDLRGRPVAITGASSGIGAATAVACAHAGMPVALAARRLSMLEAVRDRIIQSGGQAIALECDVTRQEDPNALIDTTVREFGSVYAVFANAGYAFEGSLESTTDAQWADIIDTNFWGTIRTIRPALARLREAGEGHLLVCSSCLSKTGVPYYSHYSASKAMQDHLARGLRHELAGTAIRVSSVHPIGTRTEFFERSSDRSQRVRLLPRDAKDRFLQPPERVADAVVRCLRRPKGEVWTSRTMRLGLALAVAAPGLADTAIARMTARRLRKDQDAGPSTTTA